MGVVLRGGGVHGLCTVLHKGTVDDDEGLALVFIVVDVRELFVVERCGGEFRHHAELGGEPLALLWIRGDDADPAVFLEGIHLGDRTANELIVLDHVNTSRACSVLKR